MSWIQDLLDLALTLPAGHIALFVFVAAWLELVFPPFPGDSAMLFGFFLAGQGAVSTAEVFLAAVLGSVLGSVVAFLLGERYGALLLDRMSLGRRRQRAVARSRRLFETYGEAILLVNRFIPFLRNFMIYGAGAFRLRPLPALAANAVSVMAFSGMLMAIGLLTAGSWDQIREAFQNLYGMLGLTAALALSAWIMLMARRQRSQSEIAEPLD
ncbi:MAG: DedA family protein [Holophagales bacterium]|nr:DedA family protein [Holophagales bacterium]